jgi:energy-coupling factor transporter ATP-binding protein EcfA2
MTTIERIRIGGFQSLADVDLELGAWTSLVGESDVGKSAVVRALAALLTNRAGDSFIRHGEPLASVNLWLQDGTRIGWDKARGKSGTYTLSPPGCREQTWEKTGREVPQPIRDALPMTIAIAGEDTIPGLAMQFAPPFLLADTPRRRAQVLGEFDGSNLLLVADGALRIEQRRAQQALQAARTEADAAEAAHGALDWVAAADAQQGAAAGALAAATALTARASQAGKELAHRAELAVRRADVHRRVTDAIPHGASAASRQAEALYIATAITTAEPLLREWRRLVGRAADARTPIAAARAAVEAAQDPAGIVAAAELVAQHGRLLAERNAAAEGVRGAAAEATAARTELQQLAGEACPVCGRPLSGEDLGI